MGNSATFRQARVQDYIGEVVREHDGVIWQVSDFDNEDNKLEIEKVATEPGKMGTLIERRWYPLTTIQQIIINERYPLEYREFTAARIVRFFNL